MQEAGDHAASRELLLYLGERSQELSSGCSPEISSRQHRHHYQQHPAGASSGDRGLPSSVTPAATANPTANPTAEGTQCSSNSSSSIGRQNAGSIPRRSERRAHLCFPLDGSGGIIFGSDGGSGGVCGGGLLYSGCGGFSGGVLNSGRTSADTSAAAASEEGQGAMVLSFGFLWLPTALEEVMWRVARASMGERDWDTAILALSGLAAAAGPGRKGMMEEAGER